MHCYRRTLHSTVSSTIKSKLNWLDLRKASLSVLERLLLEECLLKLDATNSHWMIVGHHSSGPHKYLIDKHNTSNNKPCIVMGIGGKPELLLELEKVRRDEIMIIKRFTGGGTVVVDPNCLWTSIIGRKGNSEFFKTFNAMTASSLRIEQVEAFPRPIMEWTAHSIFAPLFTQLNLLAQQDSPTFQLLENDYILRTHDDNHNYRKMGGNAQAIVREGWLHHTSFLWTAPDMQYLKLPSKRPKYRSNRNHSDFLVQLESVYPNLEKDCFYDCLRSICQDRFHLQEIDWEDAFSLLNKAGGMQEIHNKSRTRVLTDI
jgi:lipoate-protein ligase A